MAAQLEVSKVTVHIPEGTEVEAKESSTQFRNLVKTISGRTISSKQAFNFLELFEYELEAAIIEARRKFIEKHFGSRE